MNDTFEYCEGEEYLIDNSALESREFEVESNNRDSNLLDEIYNQSMAQPSAEVSKIEVSKTNQTFSANVNQFGDQGKPVMFGVEEPKESVWGDKSSYISSNWEQKKQDSTSFKFDAESPAKQEGNPFEF